MSDLPPGALLDAAVRKQRAAADPAVSAWVRANAGTGKTHVLVERMVRLLLSGADPRSILCLTFTKNAAAEMEARVLSRLGKWATADEATLTSDLAKLLGRRATDAELAAAPCLFAGVIDAPGGLSIMTIHGFCERILRRYSLEAGVPPGFTVLTEEEARDALAQAQAQAFASAKDGPLRDALTTVVAHAGEADFSRVLEAMLSRRNEIRHLMQVSSEDDRFHYIDESLRRLFGAAKGDTREKLLARSAGVLDQRTLKEAIAVLYEGAPTDRETSARLQAAAEAPDADVKHAALKTAFMTQTGEPRKCLMTAASRKQAPALHERLLKAQAAFAAIEERICGLKVVDATLALLRLTAAIFERYDAEKRLRAAVDFDDLIDRTLRLLSEEASDWVLYQLDGRIDHILVDEAQDTSPAQWKIIERLTSDFFSGEGARSGVPTVFAVGDEKQSIYGFQGAAPELLSRNGAAYDKKVQQAGFSWRAVDLDLSFRTLPPVLGAVDAVAAALPGLQQGAGMKHNAFRRASGGAVELWEPERAEREKKGTAWEPDAGAALCGKPAEALAARIAGQIKDWLGKGAALDAAGRPVEPGDILILLRKRQPMAGLLTAALKREGIPVCGADRVALLDELAVMDLMALASAVLQPEDDLALAEVLKSPLFGFSEDDLFELSFNRAETSLRRALEERAESAGAINYATARAKLAQWRNLALEASPFDFFSHILEAEGGRAAFASRLGAECFDALDEVLTLAETFSAHRLASLSEFMISLRRGASEVKRETDQGAREVRVMTVHGAKGLEANIVILADACSTRSAPAAPVYFAGPTSGTSTLPVWAVKGSSRLPAIVEAKDRLKDQDCQELGRLLYVAMTRARDRLYVTGFHSGDLPAGCWYETVKTALAPALEESVDFQGRPVWRYGSVAPLNRVSQPPGTAPGKAMPVWIRAPIPQEPVLPMLSPSQIACSRGTGLPENAGGGGRNAARGRGVLIHKLLEVLPQIDEAGRKLAAAAISTAFRELCARDRELAIENAFAALSNPLFLEGRGRCLAEAAIAVTVEDPSGKPRGILTGQVDRILFERARIHIWDYKSGAVATEGKLHSGHLQLAAYRLAVSRLYPDVADLQAALLNTRSLQLHRAEASMLDTFHELFAGAAGE